MTLLISENYRALNADLHRTNLAYGVSGSKWAPAVMKTANLFKAVSVLDYGCGKGTLGEAMAASPLELWEYDPAIPGKDEDPPQCDLVVCTDVLEHIEPECLDEVLNHLGALALCGLFLVVATRPAKKVLADGRNAHLTVEPAKWWLPKIMDRWKPLHFLDLGGEFLAVVKA